MGRHTPKTNNSFNRVTRTLRQVCTEEAYNGGMDFTEQTLPEGYSKLLINYRNDTNTTTLRPRYGIQSFPSGIGTSAYRIDIAYRGEVKAINDIRDIFFFGGHTSSLNTITYTTAIKKEIDGNKVYFLPKGFELKTMTIEYMNATEAKAFIMKEDGSNLDTTHVFMNYNEDEQVLFQRDGELIYTVLNNKLYVLGAVKTRPYYETTFGETLQVLSDVYVAGLFRVVLDSSNELIFEYVEPYEAAISESSTDGVNIYSPNPWNYSNEKSSIMRVEGVIARRDGRVVTQDEVHKGDHIDFEAICTINMTAPACYYQWSYLDEGTNTWVNITQEMKVTPEEMYSNGVHCEHTIEENGECIAVEIWCDPEYGIPASNEYLDLDKYDWQISNSSDIFNEFDTMFSPYKWDLTKALNDRLEGTSINTDADAALDILLAVQNDSSIPDSNGEFPFKESVYKKSNLTSTQWLALIDAAVFKQNFNFLFDIDENASLGLAPEAELKKVYLRDIRDAALGNDGYTLIPTTAQKSIINSWNTIYETKGKICYKDITRNDIKALLGIDGASTPIFRKWDDEYLDNLVPTKKSGSFVASLNTIDLEDASKMPELVRAKYLATNANSILAWGIEGFENNVYASKVNNPNYFPVLNAVNCEQPIVAVEPYLNSAIVLFTSDNVYVGELIASDNARIAYSQVIPKLVSANTGLAKEDVKSIQEVKQLLFFKSYDKFYVAAPTSTTAVVSYKLIDITQPIRLFLKDFTSHIEEILKVMYNIDVVDHTIVPSYIDYYVDKDEVCVLHRLFCATLEDPFYVDVVLRYNVVNQVWFVDMYQSSAVMKPCKLIGTNYTSYINIEDEELILLHEVANTFVDDTSSNQRIHNYQLLDSGARALDEFKKKRFRELDFVVNNRSKQTLLFNCTFILDDEERQGTYVYEKYIDLDPNSPTYGTITYTPTLYDNLAVPGVSENIELDSNIFPDLNKVKLRLKTSGKGYYGQYRLLSKNEADYELLNHMWVYRAMNAR